jgi:hypothetical protein
MVGVVEAVEICKGPKVSEARNPCRGSKPLPRLTLEFRTRAKDNTV